MIQTEIEYSGDFALIRVTGRLDTFATKDLVQEIEALIKNGHHHIVLDFYHMYYLSVAGLRYLIALNDELISKGGSLALFALTKEVADVIRLTVGDSALRIFQTEQEALQQKV